MTVTTTHPQFIYCKCSWSLHIALRYCVCPGNGSLSIIQYQIGLAWPFWSWCPTFPTLYLHTNSQQSLPSHARINHFCNPPSCFFRTSSHLSCLCSFRVLSRNVSDSALRRSVAVAVFQLKFLSFGVHAVRVFLLHRTYQFDTTEVPRFSLLYILSGFSSSLYQLVAWFPAVPVLLSLDVLKQPITRPTPARILTDLLKPISISLSPITLHTLSGLWTVGLYRYRCVKNLEAAFKKLWQLHRLQMSFYLEEIVGSATSLKMNWLALKSRNWTSPDGLLVSRRVVDLWLHVKNVIRGSKVAEWPHRRSMICVKKATATSACEGSEESIAIESSRVVRINDLESHFHMKTKPPRFQASKKAISKGCRKEMTLCAR